MSKQPLQVRNQNQQSVGYFAEKCNNFNSPFHELAPPLKLTNGD
jgi:hypothetical protein